MVEEPAEIKQRLLDRHQSADRLILGFRLLGGRADDRRDAGEEADLGRPSPLGDRALLDLLVEGSSVFDRAAIGEDGIGMFAGETDA
ncbi:hypothetical protein D3C72_1906340 [compost metagenome]